MAARELPPYIPRSSINAQKKGSGDALSAAKDFVPRSAGGGRSGLADWLVPVGIGVASGIIAAGLLVGSIFLLLAALGSANPLLFAAAVLAFSGFVICGTMTAVLVDRGLEVRKEISGKSGGKSPAVGLSNAKNIVKQKDVDPKSEGKGQNKSDENKMSFARRMKDVYKNSTPPDPKSQEPKNEDFEEETGTEKKDYNGDLIAEFRDKMKEDKKRAGKEKKI